MTYECAHCRARFTPAALIDHLEQVLGFDRQEQESA